MRVFSKDMVLSWNDLRLSSLYRNWNYANGVGFPVRFAITSSDDRWCNAEIDMLAGTTRYVWKNSLGYGYDNIFAFIPRAFERTGKFSTVLIIPTGIHADIGGHCGDGNAVARLMASCSDTLITHPNVVNAADYNELPDNGLYVEGSILTRFLMGQIGLEVPRSNRILLLMDEHGDKYFNDEVINIVSTARAILGLNCDVLKMEKKLLMLSEYSKKSGRAMGKIEFMDSLFDRVHANLDYDAFGLTTFVKVPEHYNTRYFSDDDMVNPWGGIEAMLTHSLAEIFLKPCAHAPMMTSKEEMLTEVVGVIEPRKCAETASVTFLYCVLKGLHRSPRIILRNNNNSNNGLSVEDVSCLVIPDGCIGLPTLACLENGIPVIAVRSNTNLMKNDLRRLPWKRDRFFQVENYLEAAGVIQMLKAGLNYGSVMRPISPTLLLEV